MAFHFPPRWSLVPALALLIAVVAALVLLPAAVHADPDPLADTLTRAEASGSYRFTITTYENLVPKPIPGNVGQSGSVYSMRVVGEVQTGEARASRMLLSPLPGDLPSPVQGPVEIVNIGEEVYARALNHSWQRVDDNPASVPGSDDADYLSLLRAASNVVSEGIEIIDGVPSIRYRFDMSGTDYATYLSAKLARHQTGDLQVIVPRAYRTMSGSGYLWVSHADRLPVQEHLDLYFPDAHERYEIKVKLEVAFSDHGAPLSSPITAPNLGGDAPSTTEWPQLPLSTFNPSARLRPSSQSSYQAQDRSPILNWALFVGSCLLFIVLGWRLRRRPWVHGLVSLFVVFSMLATPLLQAIGIAWQAEVQQARAAALDELLQSDPLAPEPMDPHQPPALPRRTAADLPSVDSDRDGLNDELETLLGTDDELADSDLDDLDDIDEVEGFIYPTTGLTKTWYLNPIAPDSNRDGLSDGDEMAHPNVDVDEDGIPNAWDTDNDGDGVPDSIDVSPFSRADEYSRIAPFSFEIERYDTDPAEPLCLTLQVRTTNPDHMRYHQAAFDWMGYDSRGNITDQESQYPRDRRDLMLMPMLELTMASRDHLPPENDPEIGHYAMSLVADSNKILVPLQQMTDGGAVVGLSAKLFFPASTPSWRTADGNGRRAVQGAARVVWILTAEDDWSGDRSVAAQYFDDFVVTGALAEEQHGFDIALVYDDVSWNGDAQNPLQEPSPLIRTLLNLQAGFLWGDEPSLSDLQTTISRTWNITAPLSMDRRQSEHVDAGLATTAMTATKQILAGYPVTDEPGMDVGVLFAFEQTVAAYNLDDVTGSALTFGGGRLSLNLSQSPGPVRERGLKLDWFNTHTQKAISGVELAEIIDQAYGHHWLTAEDQQAQLDLKMLLAGWRGGQTIPVQIGPTSIEYYGSLSAPEVTGVLKDTKSGWGGLKSFLKQIKRDDQGHISPNNGKIGMICCFVLVKLAVRWSGNENTQLAEGGCVGPACWNSITVGTLLDSIQQGFSAYQKVSKIWKLNATQHLWGRVQLKTSTKVLGVVSLIIELTIIWTAFFMATTDVDTSSPQYAYMLTYAIVQSVLAILMFALMFTGIGIIIVAIVAIVGTILALFGVDLQHEIAKWIAGLLVHVDQLTEIPKDGVSFGSVNVEMADSTVGIVTGNRLKYTIPVTSVILNLEEGGKGDVEDSSYTVRLAKPLGIMHATVWSASPAPQCRWDSEWITEIELDAGWRRHEETCVQVPELYVTFDEPGGEQPIDLAYESKVKLYYQICDPGCERHELNDRGGRLLDTAYYDVLPAQLGDPDDPWSVSQGLLNYHKAEWLSFHTFSHDPDGDGLADESWTSSTQWDSDGDGLSDDYERTARSLTTFAFDPLDVDSDDDGLNDRGEKFYGSDPKRRDSDGDGLRDDLEAVRADASGMIGGWEMILSGGGQTVTTWAFPDLTKADLDNDGLSDLDEYQNRSNPNGFTVSIVVDKWAQPVLRSDWPPVVRSGQSITYSLEYFYDDAPLPTTNVVFTDDVPAPLVVTHVATRSFDLDMTSISLVDPLVWRTGDLSGTNGFSVTIVAQVPGSYTASHWISNTVLATAMYASEPISGVRAVPAVIDNDDPASHVRAPTGGAFVRGSSAVFGGDADDPTSWVERVHVLISRTLPAPYSSGWQTATGTEGWAHTWDVYQGSSVALPSNDGTYHVRSRAADPVDHIETPGAGITVTVDNSAPRSQIANLSDGTAISMTILSRTYTPEGTSITVTDPYAAVYTVTGSSDDAWTMALGVDRVSGVRGTGFSHDGGDSFDAVTTSTTGLSTTWSHVWRLPFSNFEGDYRLHARANDTIGNVESLDHPITVTVDNTPPAALLFDPLADIASLRWIISGTTVVTGTAVDPDYTMIECASASPYEDCNQARARIGVAGVERVQVRISRWVTRTPVVVQGWSDAIVTPTVADGMTVTYRANWTPSDDGGYLVEARGTDAAGNTETLTATNDYFLYSHAQRFGLENVLYWADVTPPATVITNPVSGSYANDAVITVQGTVDDGPYGTGVSHVQVSTDTGQTWTTLPDNQVRPSDENGQYTWLYAWDTPVVSDVYTISVRAADDIGWMGAAEVVTVQVDTTTPVAQINDPLHGAAISGTQYAVRGVAKTGGGRDILGVDVYVDGGPAQSATMLGSGSRRDWVYTWTLSTVSDGPHSLTAEAFDVTYVQTETTPIAVAVDNNAPLVHGSLPAGWNGVVTAPVTYIISGTATEMGGTDVTAVRVQTDTGQTWQEANIVGKSYPGGGSVVASWWYTWTMAQEDWVTHTVAIRAYDRANNYSNTLYAPFVVVDNVAPRIPMTIAETTGLTTGYWYTDTSDAPYPVVTWTAAYDGGSIAGYDVRWYNWEEWGRKSAATLQATPPAAVFENSEMIFRLRSVDKAGNVSPETFLGPYRLDSEKTPSVAFTDGEIALDNNEWLPGEVMGSDTRSGFGAVTIYTTWGEVYHYPPLAGAYIFLAFDGGRLNGDGDLFIYFDTDPGVTSDGSSTTWDYGGYGTHNLPPQDMITIEETFKADYVYYVEDGETAGLMWNPSGTLGGWITKTTSVSTTFAHLGDQTEIRILWSDLGLDYNDDFHMLAFVQAEEDADVLVAFPTTNDLSGDFTARFDLSLWDDHMPNADQPQATSLELSGAALPAGAVGPGAPVTYTLHYQNGGTVDIQDVVRISVTIPSELDATCSDISGDYTSSLGINDYGGGVCGVPVSQGSAPFVLPAGASGTLTLTGSIGSAAPTGPVTVSGHIKGDMQPDIDNGDNWAYPSVLVDATPPEVEFSDPQPPISNLQSPTFHAPLQSTYVAPTTTILGLSNDNRSGTALVEIDLDGGSGWQHASGTTVWSAFLSGLADGDTRTLRVRATDAAGNVSGVETLAITVDDLPPQSAIRNPADGAFVTLGETVVVTGTSTDVRSGVERVEISLDDGETWSQVDYENSVWTRIWQPRRTGVYTLTVRAEDRVGNVETPDPGDEIIVTVGQDTTPPAITGVDPADGASDVPRNQPIVVDFDEAMDTGSVSVLIIPTTILTPVWSQSDTRLTLTHADLSASTRHTATVAAGRDPAGNPLSNAPYTWVFTTAEAVAPETDFSLDKAHVGAGDVVAGERITYTFTITNHGPTSPVTATVVDAFSTADALAAISGSDCDWTPGTTVVTCTIAGVSTGSPASLELVATTADAYSGTLSNSAIVAPAGSVLDTNPLNDDAGPVTVRISTGDEHTIYLPSILRNF